MFASLNGWHWLFFGIALLLLEVLGVGGILVGAGCGAILLASVLAVVPMSWQLQMVLFGVFALLGTIIFWTFFRVRSADNETTKLNNRLAQLVGVRVSLMTNIKGGRGKVQIQDALWTVSCQEDLPMGTLVEVTGYDDAILHVTKVA